MLPNPLTPPLVGIIFIIQGIDLLRLGPGGARTVVADSLLMKQQLLIINRSRHRAPGLTAIDRFLLGFCSLFLLLRHIQRAAIIVRP